MRVIPSQFGLSSPPAYTRVPSQSKDFDASERDDSKHAHHRSTSFSHILAGFSKSADETNQQRSGQAPQQGSSDTGDDGSAGGTGVLAAAQQAPLTIDGLLALLSQHQTSPSISDGLQPDGSAAETGNSAGQLNSSQKGTAQADLGASTGSVRALATSILPVLGGAKSGTKGTAEKTIPGQGARSGVAGSVAVPIEAQQASGQMPDSGAGFENINKADTPPSIASRAEQTENAPSAAVASGAAANAPLAFSMLLSTDGVNAGSPTATASASASGDLAGAAQMQSQHAVSSLLSTAATELAPSVATAHQLKSEPNTAPAGIAETSGPRNFDDRVRAAEQPGASTASDADANADSPRSELVRNVQVQLQADNNQRVDVRLVDQGGELRVSVRSADANLTQALQDHMPELTNRLEQQHIRAEVWIPRSTETTNAGTSNARNFSSQDGGSSGEGNSGRRQNGRQNNQPDWLEEGIPRPMGVKEKASQTWVQ